MTDWWPWLRDVGRRHLAGILAGVAVVALVYLGMLEPLDYWSLTQLFEWRGKRSPTVSVVIVALDESTISEMDEQWPYPRATHAEVIRRIAEGKPLAIGVDIIFDKDSARGPADDEALGAAVAAVGNVVLAAAVTDDITPLYTRTALNPPIPVIRRGAAGVALINMPKDADGDLRRVPVWVTLDGERLPGLGAQ